MKLFLSIIFISSSILYLAVAGGCGSNCKACSSDSSTCLVCTDDLYFVKKPDDGTCVTACDSPNAKSWVNNTVRLCSPIPAPISNKVPDITIGSANNSLVSINNLCDASAATADARKNEMVGVNGWVRSGSKPLGEAFNIFTQKDKIMQGPPVLTEAQYASQNTFSADYRYIGPSYNNFNFIGTAQSNGNIANLRVFKGVSVIEYLCVNKYNVISTYNYLTVKNDVAPNNAVRFRVQFNRNLNDVETNDLLCQVAKAIVGTNGEVRRVYGNSRLDYCSTKRVLAEKERILDYTPKTGEFIANVDADHLDDTWEQTVISKTNSVYDIFKSFASTKALTITKDALSFSFNPNATLQAPSVNFQVDARNQTVVTVSVSCSADCYFYIALYDEKTKNDISSQGLKTITSIKSSFSNNLITNDYLYLKPNENKNFSVNLTSQLGTEKNYYLLYQAENAIDTAYYSNVQSASFVLKNTNAPSSFQDTFTISSFLVLLLIFNVMLGY